MPSLIKSKLQKGELVRVACLGQLCSPKWVEIIGFSGGFDGVWLDQEHCALTLAQIEDCTRAARSCGLDTFVRLAATDYASVMRCYEAGAGGIMAAQVRSAAEAEQIVRWAKFFPRGIRGINSCGVEGRYGSVGLADYLREANEHHFISMQIENVEALDQVEQIAGIDDMDFLFLGPADLSQSMGIPGDWEHPRHWEAVERVARAASAAGKPWATLPMNGEYARKAVSLGCKMLSVGIDVWIVQRGLEAFAREFAEFFPKEAV